MSTLEHDEKYCPFCAEVIKAAAVKCRYCGSDLPVLETAGQPDPEATREPAPWRTREPNTEPTVGPTAEPTAEPTAPQSKTPSTGNAMLAIALAVIAAGLAAVLAFVVIPHVKDTDVAPNGQVPNAATRSVLMDQAGKMATTALSYNAATLDKDIAAARKLMSASMAQQYDKTMAGVSADVKKNGLVLKAVARASALVSATKTQAKVLVFLNQTTTAKGVSRQQLNENRVLVTMNYLDGRWLISRLDAF